MIIIARENFNAYGPDKLGLFAGEIADIQDDFAQKIIDEGKAYKYDYEEGIIIPKKPRFYILPAGDATAQHVELLDGGTYELPLHSTMMVYAAENEISLTPEALKDLIMIELPTQYDYPDKLQVQKGTIDGQPSPYFTIANQNNYGENYTDISMDLVTEFKTITVTFRLPKGE